MECHYVVKTLLYGFPSMNLLHTRNEVYFRTIILSHLINWRQYSLVIFHLLRAAVKFGESTQVGCTRR